MKLLLFVLSITISHFLYANTISDYYSLTNEAELLICKGQPEPALEHYDKAFQLNIEPFGKDVYNAWICAYKQNDTIRFTAYSKILIKRGAFLHDYTHENLLNQVPGGPKIERFSAIWRELKLKIPNSTDKVFRADLQAIRDADQPPRKYFMEKCKGQYNICGRDSLNTFDSLNVLKLKKLMIEKGFPTESRVGFESDFPANSPFYDIILLHDRSWTNRHTLDSLLYSKIKTGEFHPQHYVLLKDQNVGRFKDSISSYQGNPYSVYGSFGIYVFDNEFFAGKLVKFDIKKIDQARADIYLEPLREMYAKGAYQYKHQEYHFLDYKYMFIADDLPDEAKEKIKKNSFTKTETDDFNFIRQHRCQYGLRH